MKKEPFRDCATNAFRLWAAIGMPTFAEVMDKIQREDGWETWAEEHAGGLYDIRACELVWEKVGADKPHVRDAVRAVYMHEPHRPLRYREIGHLVVRFSYEYSVSERQVWNWLAEAREEFAVMRGIRVESNEEFARALRKLKDCSS